MGIFAQQFLNELGAMADVLAIAVVAVDECEEMGGAEAHLGAFVVACWGTDASDGVAVDGQSADVELSSADAFVWLAFLAYAEGEGVARYLVAIEASDAISVGYGCEVDEVDGGVDLIEVFALQGAAHECFA